MEFDFKTSNGIIEIQKAHLIVIASRYGLGKTTLGLKTINEIANHSIAVAIFSMDNLKEDLLPCLNNTGNIYIDDKRNITMTYLEVQCRKLVKEHNVKVVLVDYLQQMSQYLSMKKVGNRLKALAEELQITIIVLSQLTKHIESREDKTPRLEDIKHQNLIEQANIVIFLHQNSQNNIGMLVAKNDLK